MAQENKKQKTGQTRRKPEDSLWSQIADFQAGNTRELEFIHEIQREHESLVLGEAAAEEVTEEVRMPQNAHVHEISGKTHSLRCKHCNHSHRFAGVTGTAIYLPGGGHVHGIYGATEHPRKK